MPDFKLPALLDWPDSDAVGGPAIATGELRSVASAFAENLKRVHGLALMPPFVAFMFTTDQRAADLACYHFTQSLGTVDRSDPRYPQIIEQARAIRKQRMGDLRENPSELRRAMLSAMEHIQAYLGEEAPLPHLGPWVASIVTGTWTAYESLATDLWVRSVNLRPTTLGIKALEAKQWEKKRERVPIHPPKIEGAGEKPERNPINLDLLLEHGFDLSDKLGTVIHRSRKFDFNRGDGIEYAYTVLFDDAAKAVFKKHKAGLTELEAIRNLLVHRGGRVDRQFRDRVKANPELSRLGDDEQIGLDGEMALRYAGVVLDCGKELLALADVSLTPEGKPDGAAEDGRSEPAG